MKTIFLGIGKFAAKGVTTVFNKLMFNSVFKSMSELKRAGVTIKGAGDSALQGASGLASAGNTTKSAGRKFKIGAKDILAGAVNIIAIGAAIAIAGVGFKLMSEGCATIADSGALANVALAEMGAIMIGFMAVTATLGKNLNQSALGMLAFGGAMVGAGAGLWLLSDAATKIKESNAEGIMIGLGVGIVGVAAAFALIGEAGAPAIPFMLAFGATALATGAAIDLASTGISRAITAFSGLVDSLTNFYVSSGLAAKAANDDRDAFQKLGDSAVSIVSSVANLGEALTGALAGVGDAIHGAGLEILS